MSFTLGRLTWNSEGITHTDFNRIEENVEYIHDLDAAHRADTSIHQTIAATRASNTEIRLDMRSTDPTSPAVGQIWFRTDITAPSATVTVSGSESVHTGHTTTITTPTDITISSAWCHWAGYPASFPVSCLLNGSTTGPQAYVSPTTPWITLQGFVEGTEVITHTITGANPVVFYWKYTYSFNLPTMSGYVKIRHPTQGTVSLGVADPADSSLDYTMVRLGWTGNVVVCADIVDTTNYAASGVRIQTTGGTKAWRRVV